jgi:hypothetical protein
VIKMCQALQEAESELSGLQLSRRQAESKVRRRLNTMVNGAQSAQRSRISRAHQHMPMQLLAQKQWEHEHPESRSEGEDEEASDCEGSSSSGEEKSWDEKEGGGKVAETVAGSDRKMKRTESQQSSYRVGYLPPEKVASPFATRKMVTPLGR